VRWVLLQSPISKVKIMALQLYRRHRKECEVRHGFDVVGNAAPVPAGFTHPYYWVPFV
jgi:hypothetical protein